MMTAKAIPWQSESKIKAQPQSGCRQKILGPSPRSDMIRSGVLPLLPFALHGGARGS